VIPRCYKLPLWLSASFRCTDRVNLCRQSWANSLSEFPDITVNMVWPILVERVSKGSGHVPCASAICEDSSLRARNQRNHPPR